MLTDKQTTKPEFIWHKVDCELRTQKQSQYVKIPLKPTVNLSLKDAARQAVQTRLHIDIQKSLQYEESIGWNWHKSSNLPVFSLKLSLVKQPSGNLVSPPPSLQANIYAVKIVSNTFEKKECLYLEDLGIKGENQISLLGGCCSFTGLKFLSTSYNNQGAKFHLLIVVFKKEENVKIPKNIICSVISPPIFVDSRKSARNYQEKKYLSFVELFNPSELQKFFSKKETRQVAEEKNLIRNDEIGLYQYLTAPNIRHKVKHPLFLSVRFSNAIKIFFNPKKTLQYISILSQLSCVLNRLQKKLIKEVGMLRRNKQPQSIQQQQFAIVLLIESSAQREKMLQMLEYLDCYSICLLAQKDMLKYRFSDIASLGDILYCYKSQYFSLKKKSQKEFFQMKTKRKETEDAENFHDPKDQHQSFQRPNTLYDKILKKEEDKFSVSNLSQNSQPKKFSEDQKNQRRVQGMKALGQSFKRIKMNEDLANRNEHFVRYPLQQHMQQRFSQERMQLCMYQNNPFNLYACGAGQLIKREQHYGIMMISRQEIEEKIKQMCVQVYKRNKKSIFGYLQTLKKSNIKFQVRDVQQFIFSYSTALMDAIHYRERLLHHMFLENQILKAKVGMMQQMALTDLNKIKGNIFSMNRFLPEKFIIDKMKQNSLWDESFEKEEEKQSPLKVAKVMAIACNQVAGKDVVTEKQASIKDQRDNMAEQQQNMADEDLDCECKFVSNEFALESPTIKQ